MVMQPNVNNTNLDDDDRHAIATYLSDMLALERHIAAPVGSQLNSEDHQEYREAIGIIERIKARTEAHIQALDAQLQAVGGHAASGAKSAWSQLLGSGAAAINQARKTKVSKSLRDDFAALSFASISYTMLHATAAGLGDAATASLAKRNLDDYTPLVVEIGKVMPSLVLRELQDSGENVQVTAAQLTEQASAESWSSQHVGTANGGTATAP